MGLKWVMNHQEALQNYKPKATDRQTQISILQHLQIALEVSITAAGTTTTDRTNYRLKNYGFLYYTKNPKNPEAAASERPTRRGSQYPNQPPLHSGDAFPFHEKPNHFLEFPDQICRNQITRIYEHHMARRV